MSITEAIHILRTASDIIAYDERGLIGRWIAWRDPIRCNSKRWMMVVGRMEA